MPTVLNNIGISGDYGQIVFHNDGTDNIIDLSHSNATTVTHDLSINNTLQAGQILGTKSGKVIELSGNALMVPVGTDNQRPDNASGAVGVGEIGMIRYNTTSSTFEGYGPTAWGSLGGVINTQQKTFVEAIDEHSNHDISSNSIQFTTSGELVAVINADGRVGIGSTNPGHLLDVAGNVRFQDNLYLGEGTDNANWIQSHAILNLNSNDGETRFYTDGTQKMVLTASGGLGIGTTQPHESYTLDVSGNIAATGRIKSGATFTSDAPSTLFQGQNNTHLRAETGQILLVANGSERMRVNLDGHVGIGTNAPTTRLDISNNTANSVLAVRQHDPAQNIAEFYNGANQLMVIDNSGSLGINRSNITTDYALDVSGAAIFSKSLYIRDDADPEGAQITMEAHNNTHQWHIDISAGDFRIFKGVSAPAITVSDTTNFIALNGASPAVELDISGTGALRIPVGNNSGDRPTGANGMIRFNNTDNRYEGYDETKNSGDGGWDALGGGGGGSGQVVTNIRTLTQGETLFNIDISANTNAYMPHKVSMSDDGNRVAIADSTVDATDTTAATVKIYDYNVNSNEYEVKETITFGRNGAGGAADAEGIRGIHMTGDKNTILVVTANVTGADADASDYDGSYNFIPYELTSSDPVTYTPGTALTVDNAPWYDMDDGTTLMIAKKDATGSNRDVYFYNYSGSNKEFTLNQTVSYATDISNALPAGFVESTTAPKHVAISGDGLRALWVEEDRSNIIVFKRLSTFADFQILQTIQLGSSGSHAELLHPNFDYAGKFMAVSMPGTGNDNAIKIYAYDETKFNYVLESVFNEIDTLTDSDSLGKQEAHVSKDGTRLFVGASGATNGAIAMLKLDKQGKVPVSSGTATAEHIIYGLSSGDKFGMGLSTDYNGKRMIGVGLESGSSVSNVRVIQTQEDSITSSSTFNINEVKSVGGPLLLTPDPAHPNVGIGTTNPSEALDVSGNIISTGKVGIGTTDPQCQLHTYVVTDNSHFMQQSANNKMSIITNNSNTPHPYSVIRPENISGDDKMLMIGNGTQVTLGGIVGHDEYSWNKVIFDSPAQVGIGTTDPSEALDVSGNIQIQQQFTDSGIYPAGNLTFSTTNSVTRWELGAIEGYVKANAGTINNYPGGLAFKTKNADSSSAAAASAAAATTKMVIDANGKVGIGTKNPSARLDVFQNFNGIVNGNYAARIYGTDSGVGETGIRICEKGGDSLTNNATKVLDVYAGGSSKMVVTGGGRVGIGTIAPKNKLEVPVSDYYDGICVRSSDVRMVLGTAGSSNNMASIQVFKNVPISTPTSSSNKYHLLLNPLGGNVGIGTDIPGYPLDIKGSTNLGGDKSVYLSSGHNSSRSGTSQITIQSEFDVKASAYIATSDERIKKDILDINDDAALQKLRIIEPKTYKYKDVASRGTKTVFGFIAQQIDTVLPEAVSKLNDVIPNTYELCDATSSSNNDYYDTITFTNFNTANLDASSNNLVLVDANNKNHSVNITAVLDSSSVQVDTDLTEWMGVIDASNETVIANEVQKYKKVILDANNNVVLENYDITTIASMDASENVVGKMADLSGDNTIDSSNNYVDASGNFIAGPINTDGHYIDASGNYFDADGNFKDASGTLIGTYKAEWKKVTINGTKIFVYGQTVNDFHALNKDYIFTVATAALQEVDRQLQAEKTKTATLETEVSTLKTQMADILARVTALESA